MNVTVEGGRVLLEGEPATLFGFRVGSAPLRDDWTDELVAQLPRWREHGINTLALWLQGTSGGYVRLFDHGTPRISAAQEPIRVRANYGGAEVAATYGSTSGSEVISRGLRIVEAAAAQGMVVIVGIPYRYSIDAADTPALMARRIAAAAAPFARCANVILNVWNEPRGEQPLENSESLGSYLEAAGEAAPDRPAGTGFVRAAESIALARHPALSLLLHDAGRTLDEALEAYRLLRDCGKPVVNVESFGGRGNGYVDVRAAVAAPDSYRHPFAAWTRVFGAWEADDYVDGNGRPCVGGRSYRELIRSVAADRERRSHLMIHVGGWFQGASRVESESRIGPWQSPGRWTCTFHPGAEGAGAADGTVDRPGIRWLLEEVAGA